jgi:hypothetical protein
MVPTWFLYLTGFSMLLLGCLQIYHRPRRKGAGVYERFVNIGTFWSLLCVTVGVALLAMALGYWRGPVAGPSNVVPQQQRRYH